MSSLWLLWLLPSCLHCLLGQSLAAEEEEQEQEPLPGLLLLLRQHSCQLQRQLQLQPPSCLQQLCCAGLGQQLQHRC